MRSRDRFSALFLLTAAGLAACAGDGSTGPTSDADFARGGKMGGGTTPPVSGVLTPIGVYGVWHRGNDYCTGGTVRHITDFDADNHWLIDRGDGAPSVNLVVLSFVNPLLLLNESTVVDPLGGIPVGMTPEIVDYFTSVGIRVMLSVGDIVTVNDAQPAFEAVAVKDGRILATQVNRRSRTREVRGPDQRVSAMDAVRSATINAAWQFLEEDGKGSIEPAGLADLLILDTNPLKVPPEALFDLEVVEMINEGHTLYRRGE